MYFLRVCVCVFNLIVVVQSITFLGPSQFVQYTLHTRTSYTHTHSFNYQFGYTTIIESIRVFENENDIENKPFKVHSPQCISPYSIYYIVESKIKTVDENNNCVHNHTKSKQISFPWLSPSLP